MQKDDSYGYSEPDGIPGPDAMAGDEGSQSDWKKRHEEIEEQREMIRSRVRSTRTGNAVIRPAKPKPAITDSKSMEVGVYARVSTLSTDQTSSIENQTMYYRKKVEDTPNWNLHEIYSDEGKSGTSMQHREAFNRMLRDAADKKIDLILCASVSRFARNMSDCMTQVRKLKSMNPSHPVGVYFETENIYTLDGDSMNNLSIHAMLADWESANKSRRMILSYDQRICTGQYPVCDLLGYRHTKDGGLLIQPEEAKTVRFVFLSYIIGYGCEEIAEILTEKGRPTLRGRTDWNAGMVRSLMENERRWGDLEARKTIVIDYVEHKSKKNENERVSAYAQDHHEGIVSPEIAKAARMVSASTGRLEGGVAELSVIPDGALKGFVSVNPAWSGMDYKSLLEVSQNAYLEPELQELYRMLRIWAGKEHGTVVPIDMSGYEAPYGIFFLNQGMPSLTVSPKKMRFNKACHEKMGFCSHIEILYHPILQTVAIRAAEPGNVNSIRWVNDKGKPVGGITTAALAGIIYGSLHWKREYQFRFRGITKVRGQARLMVFALDEPQIIVPKQYRDSITQPAADGNGVAGPCYIAYKTGASESEKEREREGEGNGMAAVQGYPQEWRKNRIGLQYALRKQRDKAFDAVTEGDIQRIGITAENPLIGHLPSREEIVNELQELLVSM